MNIMIENEFEFFPVTPDRWSDFEKLFESEGSPQNCWCCVWRPVEKKGIRPTRVERKISMKGRVAQGIPIGILVYDDNDPIGWCSIAPRESYRPMGGIETTEKVWSVVCFFVKRPYRKIGLTHQLLSEAVKFAQANGADYIEAFPVDPDSPSYRFMGFRHIFEKADFSFFKRVGKRRHAMWRKLD